MFRWKALIPALIFVALIAAFLIFFLDPLIKWGLEKSLSAANGAEVDVASVRTSLVHLSVHIKGIQVTDAAQPATNTLEIGAITGDLASKPLTWKKIIIEKAEIAGIRLGTARKSPGFVRKSDKNNDGPGMADKLGEWAGQRGAAVAQQAKQEIDPKNLINADNLASLKKIGDEKGRWDSLGKEWQGRLDQLQYQKTADEVKSLVERAKGESFSGIEGVQKAQALIKEFQKAQEDLKTQTKALNDVKSQLTADIASGQAALKNVESLKDVDLQRALANIKGGLFSTEGIAKSLLGPVFGARIFSKLAYIRKIRSYIPNREGAKPAPPPPRVGRDISFPFRYNWPAFHLKIAAVSGQTPGSHPIDFSGTLKDVASDPPLIGRPLVLDLAGEEKKSGQSVTFRATLDYTKPLSEERFEIGWRGVALDGMALGNVGGPVQIKSGRGAMAADIRTRGEELSGRIDLRGDPIQLEHTVAPDAAQNKAYGLIHDVLSRIHKVEAALLLSDTITSPNVKLETTLDNQIKDAVNQVMKKELDEIRAKVRARIDELVAGRQKELAGLINARSSSLTQSFAGKEKSLAAIQDQLQKALDDLKSKGKPSLPIPGGDNNKPALPNLKKLFKK